MLVAEHTPMAGWLEIRAFGGLGVLRLVEDAALLGFRPPGGPTPAPPAWAN
jgi:hypothetical protein